jgi:hypothetical protein
MWEPIPAMYQPAGQWVTTCVGMDMGQGSGICGSTHATAYPG